MITRLMGHGSPPVAPPPPRHGRIVLAVGRSGLSVDESSAERLVMSRRALWALAQSGAATVTGRYRLWLTTPRVGEVVTVGTVEPRGAWKVTARWASRVELRRIA